jgi:hypothetical protein
MADRASFQLPAPVFRFRAGHFAGRTLDEVPAWYKQELMMGSEGGMVCTPSYPLKP